MKNLKIGRSSANDIVLSDPTVSGQHAVLTIDASSGVTVYRIKDLNSTNGTFVNGRKTVDETPVKAGDTLKFGNYVTSVSALLAKRQAAAPASPALMPAASEILAQKTIGRQQNSDISFPHQDVSSNHAILVKKKNGEILIVDKNSTNGTFVNGSKVSCASLHAGDRVLISNKYPLAWENAFPAGRSGAKTTSSFTTTIIAIAAIAVAALLFVWAPWEPWSPGKKGEPEEIFSYYSKSAVLICQTYYFEVKAAGESLGKYVFVKDASGEETIADAEETGPVGSFGTGFFVSADGKIMTNRHVMNPYMTEKEHINALKQYFQLYIEQYASAIQYKNPSKAATFRNAGNNIEVEIHINFTGIAPNDTYVTSYNDFQPCTVLGDTGSDEIDLGLIQLNSKELPAGVTTYVDLSKIDDQIIEGKDIYTIGFPLALVIGSTAQGVEAQKQSGSISQIRGNVEFGHNLNIEHGSSGSPIFSERGHLVGVVNAGFLGAAGNFNVGIQAKHASELLNKYN